MRPLAGLLIAGLALTACLPRSAALPPVDAAMADRARLTWPDTSRAQLQRGHDLVVTSCNACHQTPAVDAQSSDAWPHTVKRMSTYAGIKDPADVEAITRYYLAAAR